MNEEYLMIIGYILLERKTAHKCVTTILSTNSHAGNKITHEHDNLLISHFWADEIPKAISHICLL